MKYRARLIDPGDIKAERPVDFYSNNRDEMDAWAQAALKRAIALNAVVNLYQTREEQIAMIVRKDEA
jgi:hypothetical protein